MKMERSHCVPDAGHRDVGLLILCILAAMACGASPARAQAADAGDTDRQRPADPAPSGNIYENTVTIGLAGAYLPEFEGGRKYGFVPAPVAVGAIKGYAFLLTGNQLSVDLIRSRAASGWDLQLGPLAALNLNRSSRSWTSDPRARALGKLDPAVELGGFAGIARTGLITSPYDIFSVSVSYRRDVSGVHDSYVVEPGISYFTPLSRKSAVALYGSAKFVGGGYARTYYGISAAQRTATGLADFAPGGGLLSWTTGFVATRSVTGDLLHGIKLFAGGGYGRMEGKFARSPLVKDAGDRDQWLTTAGVAYSF